MSDPYSKSEFPVTSVSPSDLSALDLGNVNIPDFRPTSWWGRNSEIFEQAFENDTAYVAFLESQAVDQIILTQPSVKYRVGRPADLWTTNDVAIAAADLPGGGTAGYIGLADSVGVGAGTLLHFTDYNVMVRVLENDTDESEAWTNDASTTCNIKCERLSGPAVAIPAGKIALIGSVVMGEEGVPGPGYTTSPGDPTYRTMHMSGIYGSITRLQMESEMVDGWGTHPKVRDDVWYQHKLRKQTDLLFGHSWTGTDPQGAQGQLWLADGVLPQIKSHILNAGSLGVTLTGPVLNDFLEPTFDSQLSSLHKDWFCGSAQFRDIRSAALQKDGPLSMVEMPQLQSGTKNPGTLGAKSMEIQLQSGNSITVHELRKAFSASNMSDWGVILDSANIGYGSYKGIREVWYNNIETPAQQITRQTDALIDTWITLMKDESTCAVIRGGTRSLTAR